MNRRELLVLVANVTGVAVVGGDAFLMQAEAATLPFETKNFRFSARDVNLLDEIGETIIPKTDTPGAKAARVGAYMEIMVRDCYTPAQQDAFLSGLKSFPVECVGANGKSFFAMSATQRHDYLVSLEKAAKLFNEGQKEKDQERKKTLEGENKDNNFQAQKEFEESPKHFYTMVKQMTIMGFFSSETGITKTLRYLPLPGRYDGDAPYIKGQRAWG